MTDQSAPEFKRLDLNAINADLPDRIGPVGDHVPVWESFDCPSCGSAPCGPHPAVLACGSCDDDWPCPPVQMVIREVEDLADGLCCGGELWARAERLRGVVSVEAPRG
ncbi:MAG: hypothetical protein K0Q93_3315 [Nocardioidaceae bacterium]|nr:hypothetical protein [Nocardioidaceae bacterium]